MKDASVTFPSAGVYQSLTLSTPSAVWKLSIQPFILSITIKNLITKDDAVNKQVFKLKHGSVTSRSSR